ncbi:MAG: hypothetical protein ABSH09_15395 [Bryobacteraceae bacterium]
MSCRLPGRQNANLTHVYAAICRSDVRGHYKRKGRDPAAPYKPETHDWAERVAVRFARVPYKRKGRDPAAPYKPETHDWAERVAVRFARVP